MQVAVVAVFFDQEFLMAAMLDYLPFVHDDDAVDHAHGGEVVGDDEHCAVAVTEYLGGYPVRESRLLPPNAAGMRRV